ncbi:MAG: ABC transporter ATP-binding protein [Candidatus Methanoplasma sp.]|jgi:iron complex transport system ATP-binding protein|nr:ABC transporter ATP-binding protein [Candidatus Methanoplasma sp.]
MLEIRNLGFSYGDLRVLKGLELSIGKGLTSIIGPNAAGKTTLMRCIAGLMDYSGKIDFRGEDIRESSEKTAFMPQEMPERTSLSVMEVILMGMLDRLKWRVDSDDIEAAYAALYEMGIEDLAARHMNELSGGQCQMVMIAQCLVRNPKLLLMDEPINNLDLCRQLEMFEIVKKATTERDLSTIMILHDISLAARYSDRMIILSNGSVHSTGHPCDVVTEEMLRDVYGVEASVKIEDGVPHLNPKRSIRLNLNSKKQEGGI